MDISAPWHMLLKSLVMRLQGVTDALGICTDMNGSFAVEVNTEAVRAATQRSASKAQPVQAPAPGRNQPMLIGQISNCQRNSYCNKVDGHPGRRSAFSSTASKV